MFKSAKKAKGGTNVNPTPLLTQYPLSVELWRIPPAARHHLGSNLYFPQEHFAHTFRYGRKEGNISNFLQIILPCPDVAKHPLLTQIDSISPT